MPAIERLMGTHAVQDVLSDILNLQAHLWPMENSAAVTEFVPYPQVLSCNVWLAGGDLKEIKSWQAPGGDLEAWARFQGCRMMETTGRQGIAKVMDGKCALTKVVRALSDG